MRSKIFRQVVQINQGKADALPRFFGQADGIIFKQAVRLELCGVAFIIKQALITVIGKAHCHGGDVVVARGSPAAYCLINNSARKLLG